MTPNALPWETTPLVDYLAPITVANTEKLTAGTALGEAEGYRYILGIGDVASESIDFRVEVADDSNFATNKTTVKAATQLAAHASNNDNKFVEIFVRAIDCYKASATAKYIRARAITGGATGGPGAIMGFAVLPRSMPQTKIAAIVEQAKA